MAAAVVSRCRGLVCGLRALRCSIPAGLCGRSAGPIGDGFFCEKSTYSALPDNYNCKVELALTSDGKTIVCFHPAVDIPYEHTKPIPKPDPTESHEETHDQILKARLSDAGIKTGPTMEELSKMFYTTKHRWYPVGQYHRRRMRKDHPKDR